MNRPLFPDLVVNGVTIPSAAVAAEAQNHSAPQGKPGLAWRKAARALITREVLLQEAARLGLSEAPRDLGEGRKETPEEALIRGLVDSAVTAETPKEAEVRAYWARDPDRFRAPPLWEVSHILVAADPADAEARATAKAKAQKLLEAVQKDPKSFARLAESDSDCSSSSSGGFLGQLSPGDTVPEFETALRAMSEGETSAALVETRFGFHILRLDAEAPGRVLPYEVVAPKLRAAMEKSAWVQAARAFTQGLIDAARIEGMDPAAL
jgi:peptidyl-prolyl cis-trans isomerase C